MLSESQREGQATAGTFSTSLPLLRHFEKDLRATVSGRGVGSARTGALNDLEGPELGSRRRGPLPMTVPGLPLSVPGLPVSVPLRGRGGRCLGVPPLEVLALLPALEVLL